MVVYDLWIIVIGIFAALAERMVGGSDLSQLV